MGQRHAKPCGSHCCACIAGTDEVFRVSRPLAAPPTKGAVAEVPANMILGVVAEMFLTTNAKEQSYDFL